MLSGVLALLAVGLLAGASLHVLVSRMRRAGRNPAAALPQAQAADACAHAIVILQAHGAGHAIEYVNPAFERITGFSAAEAVGRGCDILWHADAAQPGAAEMLDALRREQPVRVVLRARRSNGEDYWSELNMVPVRDAGAAARRFVVTLGDVTEARRCQAELEFDASHDELTGLANRKLLHARLAQALADANRNGDAVWVLFLNIDCFKSINDTLGYGSGNLFLKQIAQRLRAALREDETAGHFGGDEFVLVLRRSAGEPRTPDAVRDVLDAVLDEVTVDGARLMPGASLGIAIYPEDGRSPEALISNANRALRCAKSAGRGQIRFYEFEMNVQALHRLRIESALRDVLERADLLLHYQPQVDLVSGNVVGMEALLRWRHPLLESTGCARVIEVAEESGLIIPIGEWVLRTACTQAKAWRDAGYGDLRISVNLSARQFIRSGTVEFIGTVLRETGLPAHLLELELTERFVMEDIERTAEVLSALHALGVQLSIDDFGTSYSSLACLKRFPIDFLKIDQSFVHRIAQQSSDASISMGIIWMAHSLGMRVIAEGVETEDQCEFLARNMCDEIQGYLFAAPGPAEEIEALLAQRPSLPQHLLRMQKRERTLLLVDDEPNILAALKRLMRTAGYRILTAGSGKEGLDVLERNEVDVIVSDQRMPGMTGVEFLRTVKTLYPETVRMVLSGFTELQSVTDAVNEGAIYKFLTKPWDDAQLREHVEKAFQDKEMADENRRLNLEVRNANRELARANRQLEAVLEQKQQKIQRNEITLDIVREALQHVPLPIIGLDDDEVVAFANGAAQELFKSSGLILGSDAALLMPDVLQALRATGADTVCATEVNGQRFNVVSRSMGRGTRSRGELVIFTREECA